MFEVNDIPPIDGWELQQLIAENVQHEEFLFFRFYAGDEQDYFGPDSYTKRYECFCTACRERFTEPHSAGPASKWRMCPRCGRSVTPKRWAANDHAAALRKVSFAFHFFQVGPHGELWLTSCQVRMYPYFLLEKYTAFEYCRYVFSAAGAKKWSWQYDGWALRKNCTFRHWYDMGGGRRDDFWVLPSEQELAASEVLMLLSYHEQGGKKRDLTARLEHLAGELADVVNVTEQIIQLFGLETDFKVARHAGIQKTLKRIREEEQANEVRNEPARLDF